MVLARVEINPPHPSKKLWPRGFSLKPTFFCGEPLPSGVTEAPELRGNGLQTPVRPRQATSTIQMRTGSLALQPTEEAVQYGLSVLFVNRSRQRNNHRTCFNAVLRVAAVRDAVVAHDPFQTFVAVHLSRGMHVEKTHLRDRLWSNVLIIFILRARFQTTTASHAA